MIMRALGYAFLAALAGPLASLAAQAPVPVAELRGRTLLPDSSTGVPGILVVATDASGAVAARTLSSASGDFLLRVPRPARYVVRALRIGFSPSALPPFDIAAGEKRHADIVLRGMAVSLAGITVTSDNSCRSPNDSAQLVVRLWEQARTALSATALGGARAPLTATVRVYERTLDASGAMIGAETSRVLRGPTMHPFASLAPDSLARVGYVAEEADGVLYRAPDADVLISDSFAALHCLWVQAAPPDHHDWIGIGVRPSRERRGVKDIEGTLWLDRATSELRAFEYRYTGLPAEVAGAQAGGRVEFLRLPTAHWIVSRWSIRMPQTAVRKGVSGVGVHARIEERTFVQAIRITGGETMDVERDGVSLYHVVQPVVTAPGRTVVAAPERTVVAATGRATAAGADSAAVTRPANAARGAVVSGRIMPEHDTVGIPGVEVELVGSGMRRYADAKGQFRFVGVAEGGYDLRVRSVGFKPWVAHLDLLDGRLYDSDIKLQRLPNILTEVRIEGRQVKVPVRFADVYQRAALGRGKFFTAEDIDRLNPLDLKTLLSTLPAVLVDDRGITFQRCQGGFQGMAIGGGGASLSSSAPSAAAVQVYIDGVRMTRSGKVQVPNPNSGVVLGDDYDVEHALKIVPPSAIQAIEIYTGLSQIPVEFLEDACAVIAIWTKSY
jgi:hypothetical protein